MFYSTIDKYLPDDIPGASLRAVWKLLQIDDHELISVYKQLPSHFNNIGKVYILAGKYCSEKQDAAINFLKSGGKIFNSDIWQESVRKYHSKEFSTYYAEKTDRYLASMRIGYIADVNILHYFAEDQNYGEKEKQLFFAMIDRDMKYSIMFIVDLKEISQLDELVDSVLSVGYKPHHIHIIGIRLVLDEEYN
jgi:hypothetical protein